MLEKKEGGFDWMVFMAFYLAKKWLNEEKHCLQHRKIWLHQQHTSCKAAGTKVFYEEQLTKHPICSQTLYKRCLQVLTIFTGIKDFIFLGMLKGTRNYRFNLRFGVERGPRTSPVFFFHVVSFFYSYFQESPITLW